MEKKNRNLYRYIAGGLLALSLVWGIAGAFAGSFGIWNAVGLAATALMMVAMFTEKYVLLAVGAALRIPNLLVAVFQNGRFAFSYMRYRAPFVLWGPQLSFLLNSLLTAVGWVLLILAVYNRSKSKKLCILSVGLHAAGFVVWAIAYIIVANGFDNSIPGTLVINLLTKALTCVPIALAGFVLQRNEMKTVHPETAPVATVDTSERIDKLMKLKELLDSGVLSQEEFEAKKKELLDI